jgi:hypothetical protein
MKDSAEFEVLPQILKTESTKEKGLRWWELLLISGLCFLILNVVAGPLVYVFIQDKPEEAKWSKAQTEMIEIAKAVNMYALGHNGKWPSSLTKLTTAFPNGVPKDPFTKEPYVYSVNGDDFTIKSMGVDNKVGGKESPDKDIVVTRAGFGD